tara:strand:+ start:612 stop:1994 length:1383 start_codon:yes stop_codon:yes gene_type:complete
MSAPILNSNANSALISTLSSSDALVNPHVYSLEKLLPFGASYTTDVTPVQGSGQSFGPSSVIDYDLPKWGLLRNMCLNFQLVQATTLAKVSVIGAIGCIDNIELLSSSRRILNLTGKDLLCLYSDLPTQQRKAIVAACINVPDGAAITSGNNTSGLGKTYSLNIPFALLMNHKLNPNLLFQEPQRVRITLSDLAIGASAVASYVTAAATAASVFDPVLKAEYFNPPRELEDQTIQENYGDGSLSVVAYDFSDENVSVGGTGVGIAENYDINKYVEVEIKDVGVVSDIYFYLNQDAVKHSTVIAGTASAANQVSQEHIQNSRTPRPMVRCELSANGQVIFSKNHYEMTCWGRKSDGSVPFSMGMESGTGTFLDHIYKIPMGLSDDKRFPSGGVSLRELHNVRLRVWYQTAATAANDTTHHMSGYPADATYKIKPSLNVQLRKFQILTTESASGRVITSVAN